MTIPQSAQNPSFSPDSKVWVYVASRPLSQEEAAQVQAHLDIFCKSWTAHNQALQAFGEVFDQQAIILMVDESRAHASGCSIDKSVHFLEALGRELGLDFFERMRFGWQDAGGASRWADRAELAALVASGEVGSETPMYNTLVTTKGALEAQWLLPFGKSWHRRVV